MFDLAMRQVQLSHVGLSTASVDSSTQDPNIPSRIEYNQQALSRRRKLYERLLVREVFVSEYETQEERWTAYAQEKVRCDFLSELCGSVSSFPHSFRCCIS